MSSSFRIEECDALLSVFDPCDELFSFGGPKGWMCNEPLVNYRYNPKWRKALRILRPEELLDHRNSDPTLRLPPPTHTHNAVVVNVGERMEKPCALVSNIGDKWPWRQSFAMKLRRDFVTCSEVDLFGNNQAWQRYRTCFWSRPCLPKNYKGELPGHWDDGCKLNLLARYKINICMENSIEPFYFSEKFVNAVEAGCIPVYHAHSSVREGILTGAKWVDPQDFNFDAKRTLAHALDANSDAFLKFNKEWLMSDSVRATSSDAVHMQAARILANRVRIRRGERFLES